MLTSTPTDKARVLWRLYQCLNRQVQNKYYQIHIDVVMAVISRS